MVCVTPARSGGDRRSLGARCLVSQAEMNSRFSESSHLGIKQGEIDTQRWPVCCEVRPSIEPSIGSVRDSSFTISPNGCFEDIV